MSTTDQPAPATGAAGDAPPQRYTAALAAQLELAWQQRWADEGTFEAPNPSGPWGDAEAVADREPLFVMDMFPYPSGAGLHVGHPLGYIATDVWARYQRMSGRNVLHTLGYDAFGLPAEQYAVQTGQHPRVTTEANIANMRRQLRRLGLAHDARRSISTIDPDYYRWTQWIFREVFESWYDPEHVRPDGGRGAARPIAELREAYASGRRQPEDGSTWADLDEVARRRLVDDHRLAYISEAPVNWCPGLGTVLANEEVTADGRSERGNFPVVKRPLRQWMMRITAYADRLVDDLDRLDWPEAVKSMQRHWIGRSTGAQVTFSLVSGGDLEVFTTRPDTLFGVTFMVVAPEHSSLDDLPAAWPDGTPSSWTGGGRHPLRGRGRLPDAGRRPHRGRAHRRGPHQDRRLHRTARGQPRHRHRRARVHGRLRAGRLRHRGDHGRARPGRARPRLRRALRAARRPHGPAAGGLRGRRLHGRRSGDQLLQRRRRPGRPGGRRGQGAHHRAPGAHRRRTPRHHVPPARLAVQPPALLGRAVPGGLRRARPARRRPGGPAAGAAAGRA
ncbi:MAG: class I tRNA ligase family protein [Quadrisphaera sp.]